jgi:DNA-binding GntR family transcriptional regulator
MVVDTMVEIVSTYVMKESIVRDGGLLADNALAYIRSSIYEGRIGPGDRINELEISQTLGISRGPVREAIRRLSSSGLVVYEPNIGTRVVSPDADDVAQLYAVRESLESLAAGLAATQMTDAERATLTATLDAHEAQMTEANSTSYPRGGADWDFHLLILKASRNSLIWRICGDELRDMFSLLRSRHGSSPGRGRQALKEHRWIAEAIVAGDADLASTLMAQHIRASRNNLLKAMHVAPIRQPRQAGRTHSRG